ncbi:MAG: hypothetical protein K8W52_27715 [Deltaproteobacteria bacterium]|nr:hypothetical protein [Deltaproteobacteria bacterium]
MRALLGPIVLLLLESIARAQPAAAPPPVPPAAPPAPPAMRLEVHGFVGGSLYLQDAAIGPFNGGGAWFVTGAPTSDRWSLGGDVRQSRINISVAGPPVMAGATPKAVVELDLFGGNGAGAFGDASVLPRLRVAYAELGWAHSTVQVGQAASLVLAMVPATVGHAAYPLTYSAGTIGWRFPGVFATHTIALAAPKTAIEVAAMIARPAWQNPNNAAFDAKPFVSQDSFGMGLGEASGLPQLEARIKFVSPRLEAFGAAHFHRVDRTGTGAGAGAQVDLDVVAANAGIKLKLAPITVAASGYVGKNLAPLCGTLLQFQGAASGDVHEWGAWTQAEYAITPQLSAFALAGIARPRASEARAAGLTRIDNRVASGMMRYLVGGYAVGLEVTRWHTRVISGAGSTLLRGDQVMTSATFTF